LGVVVNQSIKNLIITGLGFGIGAINTLFLFTHFMSKEGYGLVTYILSTSNLVWPLMIFGVHNTIVKFFTGYASKKEQNKFLSMMLFLPAVIAVVLGIIGAVFYNALQGLFEENNNIIKPYVWTIFVIALAITYFEVFFAWSKVKLKSVFGNFMKELFTRIYICIFLFLVYFEVLSVPQFIYGLVIAYTVRTLILMWYALRLHTYRVHFSLPENYVSVFKYSILILVAGSVASLLISLDTTMLERYVSIGNIAVYKICAFIASVIVMPSRAMHQITYPLTAKLMNEKKHEELRTLYRQSSLNLFVIAGLFFVLIVCNVTQLYKIIPDQYQLFIWIVVLIGSAKLFDSLLGNNNAILYNSDYYRWVLITGVGMAIMAIVLNLICIPIWGLNGAAFASFAAIFCYNIAKLWLVQLKFGMHPFSGKIGGVFVLIFILALVFYFWEFSFHPIMNMVLKSALILFVYGGIVLQTKLSPEITGLVTKFIKKSS